MIIVECFSDESLMKNMGFSKIKHEGGKGRVMEKVKKNYNPGVIGIIDEDPDSNQPSEITEYIKRESRSTIKLLVSKDDERRKIIQISPYLEAWILNRARQNQISPRDFGLPNDPHELHSMPRIDKRQNFQKFLKKLIELDEEIDTLKQWLRDY